MPSVSPVAAIPSVTSAMLSAPASSNAHRTMPGSRWAFELAGADSIAMVTDGMAATGLTDGTYTLGAAEVRVQDGVASLVSNGSIAGGTATMLEVLRRTVAAGVPLGDALRSATVVPARVLGLAGEAGSLTAGALADLLVVGEDLRLEAVMRRGEWISGTPPR